MSQSGEDKQTKISGWAYSYMFENKLLKMHMIVVFCFYNYSENCTGFI